jgi:hypothetical protein
MYRYSPLALFAMLFATVVITGACGGRKTATSTPAPTHALWWEAPARFLSANGDHLTFISNMGSLASKFGVTDSLPSCKDTLATPPPRQFDQLKEAFSRAARLDPLVGRMYPDVAREAGFDPCSPQVVLQNAPVDPVNGFYAYAVEDVGSSVQAALTGNGYAQRTVDGSTVFTKGSDGDLTSTKLLSALDRVAVLPGWIITASSSAAIQAALDSYSNSGTSAVGTPIPHALLSALDDFDAVAFLDSATADDSALQRDLLLGGAQPSTDWGSLDSASRVAIAYVRTAAQTDVVKVGLYYDNPARLDANRLELAKRLGSYESRFYKTKLCSAADATIERSGNASVVVGSCTTSAKVIWTGLIVARDLTFLIHALPGTGR